MPESGLRPKAGHMWSCDEKFVRAWGADHYVFTVRDITIRGDAWLILIQKAALTSA